MGIVTNGEWINEDYTQGEGIFIDGSGRVGINCHPDGTKSYVLDVNGKGHFDGELVVGTTSATPIAWRGGDAVMKTSYQEMQIYLDSDNVGVGGLVA